MMIYYDVLTKKEKELWDLTNSLAMSLEMRNAPRQQDTTSDLTSFTLEQRLVKINEIWRSLFDTDLIPQGFNLEEGSVYISDDQRMTFQKHLLENSLGNAMLVELFMGRLDLQHFMARHDISQASAYRIRREVQEALENYDLGLKLNVLSGDELTIRNLFNSVLLFRQLDLIDLDGSPDRVAIATEGVAEICKNFGIAPRLSEKNLLHTVIFTANVRYSQGNFLNGYAPIKKSYIDEALLEKLSQLFQCPINLMHNEANNFMIFLYAFNFITNLEFEPSREAEKIQQMAAEFQENIGKIPSASLLPMEKSVEMQQAFRRLHWRNHLFPIFFKGFGFIQNEEWGTAFYPLYKTLDELYRKYEILSPGYIKAAVDRKKLYVDYFYTWINFSSDKSYLPEVNVCVDFSQDAVMENMISQIFSNVWLSNLVVQNTLDQDTDIYLADRQFSQLDIPVIVWTSPPHYRELLDLIRVAGEVALKKKNEEQ